MKSRALKIFNLFACSLLLFALYLNLFYKDKGIPEMTSPTNQTAALQKTVPVNEIIFSKTQSTGNEIATTQKN